MTSSITGILTNCFTQEDKIVDLVVGTYRSRDTYGSENLVFRVLQGGPTGYESFIVTEESIKALSAGWCACAGTPRRWDKLIIPGDQMRKAFKELGL